MAGIHEQLERPGVAHIVQALEAAKSSYLKPFLELSKMIQMGHEEAVDNLKFLQNLVWLPGGASSQETMGLTLGVLVKIQHPSDTK